MKSTKLDGTKVVGLRTQIGATRPSGCNGEVGVSGERGECRGLFRSDEESGILRGGKRMSWVCGFVGNVSRRAEQDEPYRQERSEMISISQRFSGREARPEAG